jgi:hypothetical protein
MDLTKDIECLKFLLSTKFSEDILKQQDEGYGNTPLHIAIAIHSVAFATILKEVSPLSIKNKAG